MPFSSTGVQATPSEAVSSARSAAAIQHAGGLLVLVELATVQAEPPAVLDAHLVGEKDVGMQLRVRGTRGAVEEARGDKALGVDLEDPACAASREGRVVLQEIERARNRAFVRGNDGCAELFAAGSPQHRDALGRTECQPEAGDDVVVVRREATTHRGAVAGIGAVTDEALEAERVDLRAGEPDCLCSAAEVAAGVLRGAGEVVLAAGRDLLGEVAPAGGTELRQAHHGREAPEEVRPCRAHFECSSVWQRKHEDQL